MIVPILISGLLSFHAFADPYPKKDDCYFSLIPAGSTIKLKKPLVFAPGQDGLMLPPVVVRYPGGNWVSAYAAQVSNSPQVAPQNAVYTVTKIELARDVKNCISISVTGSVIDVMMFCSSTYQLEDLRIRDFKEATKNDMSLELASKPGDQCWIPRRD